MSTTSKPVAASQHSSMAISPRMQQLSLLELSAQQELAKLRVIDDAPAPESNWLEACIDWDLLK
ncbi:hypothetical protein [Stenotrophomonas sp. SY1]|uniref:hypothetical protein n=1 Tax=Stenotrophomonas sp. SY1 TaxID=477235 RepID=UPI001E2B78B0|nr:hypothetical protein [Stenotrophomonas sp. SY1]MCD9087125.1 hypothetical protein [Stenotrophomonas sp. SY1]